MLNCHTIFMFISDAGVYKGGLFSNDNVHIQETYLTLRVLHYNVVLGWRQYHTLVCMYY